MRIVLLTNEYPPNVYGGAGVHIEHLSTALAALDDGAHEIVVRSFGDQDVDEANLHVRGVEAEAEIAVQDPRHARLMDTLVRNLRMAGDIEKADIVHAHTWYAHFAGCLVQQLAGAKLVLTTHSLEPHRPWKVEQLGSAYNASAWIERVAYENADGVVAVSRAMREDVHELYRVPLKNIRVIPNGIDPAVWKPTEDPERLRGFGIDLEKPYVLFVGRITRQKGIIHLVRALHFLPEGTQVVLAAGAPDTPEIAEEMKAAIEAARATSKQHIIWIPEMLLRRDLIALYSGAYVFVCPSVYEPFGIINLEAMACARPVVASAVGGIPEVVQDGVTGLLVATDPVSDTNFEPSEPEAFARGLAAQVTSLLRNPARAEAMGAAGRHRVEARFSWEAVARQTLDFYQSLLQTP